MTRQVLPKGVTVETTRAIVARVGKKKFHFGKGATGEVTESVGLGSGMRKVRFHVRGREAQEALVHIHNLVTDEFY